MSFEGVWKVEMLGPYGWEKMSTAIVRDGQYFAASTEHHSVGDYEEDGEKITVRARITQDGKMRTVFGETKKRLEMRIDAEHNKSGKVVGFAYPADNKNFKVKVRLTRLEKLD